MGIEIGLGREGRTKHGARRGEQPVAALKFKGWMVIPALVLVIAFVIYRATAAGSALSGPQGELLKNHLQGEYASLAIPEMNAALAAGDDEGQSRLVQAVLKTDQIEFTGVRVKGVGEEVIARVTIEVGGATPPDGRSVRYFLMRHRFGGWQLVREVRAFHYYTKLF